MKRQILVIGLVWAGTTLAGENKSLISDLIWTHPAESETVTNLSVGQTSSKTKISTTTLKDYKNEADVSLGYGLNSNLSVLVDLTYGTESTTISGAAVGGGTYHSSGLEDPLIGAKCQRVLNKDLMYNALVAYSPSLGNHNAEGQNSTGGLKTGDMKHGGDTTLLVAGLGSIYETYGYQAELSLKQNGKATKVESRDDSQTTTTYTLEYNLLISGEYFINKDFAVGANIDLYNGPKETSKDAAGASTIVKYKSMQPLYGIVAGYNVTPRNNVRLIASSGGIDGTSTSASGADTSFTVDYLQYKLQWVMSF